MNVEKHLSGLYEPVTATVCDRMVTAVVPDEYDIINSAQCHCQSVSGVAVRARLNTEYTRRALWRASQACAL